MGLSDAKYEITRVAGVLTITERPVTVTVDDATRQEGQANPVFTGTVTGLIAADGLTVEYTSTATAGSAPGTYPITATLQDPNDRQSNYAVTITAGTLTITAAPPPPSAPTQTKVTVTVNSATRTYGAANPNFTANVAGLPAGESLDLIFSTTATPQSAVGTYPITATAPSKGGYMVEIVAGTLTVERAPLTVTPRDATRNQGVANPTLTGTITGLQNGDAITATYTTTATSTSAAGTYPITAVLVDPAGKLANYTVTLKQGSLTVALVTLPGRNTPITEASLAVVVVDGLQSAIQQSLASGAGAPRIVLQPDPTAAHQGALISAEALGQIVAAGGEVQVDTSFGSLLLPAPLLAQFQAQNSGSELIIIFSERGQAEAGPNLTAASPIVEVTLGWRAPDGTITQIDSFTSGLTLTLPLAATADADLAGIYRFETNVLGQISGATYVGGEVSADGRRISVRLNRLGKYGVLVYDRAFTDVTPDHWAYRAIKVMTARHVVQGVGADLFHPERSVTHAEFAAMVARAWSLPMPEPDNNLRPEDVITRQEMAMVIARAMQRFYPQAQLPTVDAGQSLAPFADAAELTLQARADMANLVAAGLIKGRSSDSLAPNGTTTRAEAATLIWRLLEWGRK